MNDLRWKFSTAPMMDWNESSGFSNSYRSRCVLDHVRTGRSNKLKRQPT